MTRKIALITGGSRGLGRSAALHLARAGADVVLTYHGHADAAREAVAEVEAAGAAAAALRLDVADAASFGGFAEALAETLQERFGRSDFDWLLNNAGTGIHAPFAETTPEQFDRMVAEHLRGPFFLTQALLPMIADGGRILNVSSGLARFATPGYAAYAAAKGGVEVLTRYLAQELGPRGIAVNAIAPGAIETDFAGGLVRDDAGLNGMLASRTAMGRVGRPDDVGAAVASILAGGSQWITAQRIEASGGYSI